MLIENSFLALFLSGMINGHRPMHIRKTWWLTLSKPNCLKFFMFGWKYLTFEVDDSIRPRRARQKEWVNMWKISLYVWVGSQGRVPRCVSVKSWNREIRPVFPWHAFLWFFFFWSSKSKKVNEWLIKGGAGLLSVSTLEYIPLRLPRRHL